MEFNIGRYKNRIEKEYEMEVVTPMFLGGADGKSADLRTASIKGALRFWWRALYGGDNIEKMKEREANIFGNTKKSSMVNIMISDIINNKKLVDLPRGKTFLVKSSKMSKTFNLGIIDYLAYGLYDYEKKIGKNVYNMAFIKSGTKFKLFFQVDKQYFDEVNKAFYALINYGGLGSRSRNGFGSLSFLNNHQKASILVDRELNGFSAVSKFSKLFIFNSKGTWEDALSEIGLRYREARLSLESKHQFEKRGLIAMPIEAKGETIPDYIRKGRHSKPYFLHINKLPNNKYQGQILFMPYKYYKPDKFNNYINACNDMNKILSAKSVEVRNELS